MARRFVFPSSMDSVDISLDDAFRFSLFSLYTNIFIMHQVIISYLRYITANLLWKARLLLISANEFQPIKQPSINTE